MPGRFERYVAVGDSTTEGLDDPDGCGGYRGWANRLAEHLAARQGGVLYANLAVRGRLAAEIRAQQLDCAVSLRPDLASVVAGMNDLLRPGFDAARVGHEVERMQRELIAAGATVVTFTLPDLTPVLPFARRLAPRTLALNAALRHACARTGARLLDLAAHPFASDPRMWSADRFHANSEGHARIAAALAHTLELPGADGAWARPLPPAPALTRRARRAAELAWLRRYLLPWLWRRARGRSSGDGRAPKRPQLAPFDTPAGTDPVGSPRGMPAPA
jgi:lysophospholipase L1-like esterase